MTASSTTRAWRARWTLLAFDPEERTLAQPAVQYSGKRLVARHSAASDALPPWSNSATFSELLSDSSAAASECFERVPTIVAMAVSLVRHQVHHARDSPDHTHNLNDSQVLVDADCEHERGEGHLCDWPCESEQEGGADAMRGMV